mgnify:CR=1 FL=1
MKELILDILFIVVVSPYIVAGIICIILYLLYLLTRKK